MVGPTFSFDSDSTAILPRYDNSTTLYVIIDTLEQMKKRSERRKHYTARAAYESAVRPPSLYRIWSGLLNSFKSY